MKSVTVCALAAGLALVAAGCGGTAKQAVGHSGVSPVAVSDLKPQRGPFGAGGEFGSGPGSGLSGDTVSGPDGDHVGCIAGRRYAQAVSLRNTTKHAVTVTGASGNGPESAPQIITRVATQLRLAPPPPTGDLVVIILRHWSDARTRPVRIPAGRSVVVQSNFRMARCRELAGGRTLVVPGALRVTYRASGKIGTQIISVPVARIILTEGPTKQSCAPAVGGSSSIIAADISCEVARQAAVACHRMSHGSWGMCTSNRELWECGRAAGRRGWALTEICYLPSKKSHWFRLSWKHGS